MLPFLCPSQCDSHLFNFAKLWGEFQFGNLSPKTESGISFIKKSNIVLINEQGV